MTNSLEYSHDNYYWEHEQVSHVHKPTKNTPNCSFIEYVRQSASIIARFNEQDVAFNDSVIITNYQPLDLML